MRTFALLLFIVTGVTAFAVDINRGDVLETEVAFNLRSNPKFTSADRNVVATVPKDTQLTVAEVRRMPSGNLGIQVMITGPADLVARMGPGPFWIYYNHKNPSTRVVCAPGEDCQTRVAPVPESHAETTRNTVGVPQDVIQIQVDDGFLNDDGDTLTPLVPLIPVPAKKTPAEEDAERRRALQAQFAPLVTRPSVVRGNTSSYDPAATLAEIARYRSQSMAVAPHFTNADNQAYRSVFARRTSTTVGTNSIPQSECSDTKLTDREPGKSLFSGPQQTRNQGQLGYCYAYTMADVLSLYTGTMVSAADIGLLTQLSPATPGTPLSSWAQWSRSSYVLEDINLAGGACPESVLPSDDYGYSLAAGQEYSAALQRHNWSDGLSARYQDGEQLYQNLHGRNPAAEATQSCSAIARLQDVFTALPYEQIVALAESASDSSQFLQWLRTANCNGRRIPLRPTTLQMGGKNIQTVNDQISAGNIVGINYQIDLLGEKNSPSKNLEKAQAALADALKDANTPAATLKHLQDEVARIQGEIAMNPDALHASSIIGRRWNAETGQCQFLLRNSWGAGVAACKDLYPELDKAGSCNPEDGTLWINVKDMHEKLHDFYYLEPPTAVSSVVPAPRRAPATAPVNGDERRPFKFPNPLDLFRPHK